MKISAFRRLAAAYGADLTRWPEAQQAEARRLLVSSAEAQALLQAEAALDTALAKLLLPQPDATDLARLQAGITTRLDAPKHQPYRRPALPRWSWLWAGASGMVAAGVAVGLLTATPSATAGLLSALQPAAIPVFSGS